MPPPSGGPEVGRYYRHADGVTVILLDEIDANGVDAKGRLCVQDQDGAAVDNSFLGPRWCGPLADLGEEVA